MKRFVIAIMLFIFCLGIGIKGQEYSNAGGGPQIMNSDTLVIDLYSLPSPEEIISYIVKGELSYNESVLNKNPIDRYSTSTDQLLAMGVYLADMAYTVNFKKAGKSMEILKNIEDIGKRQNIIPPFSQKYRERLTQNLANTDSLKAIYDELYKLSMNNMFDSQRYNQYAIVSLGCFVESLFLTLNSTDIEFMGTNLKRRIIDQKMVYDQLLEMCNNYLSGNYKINIFQEINELSVCFAKLSSQARPLSYKTRYDGAIRIGSQADSYDSVTGFNDLYFAVNTLRAKWVK